jgi:hypothetical protein
VHVRRTVSRADIVGEVHYRRQVRRWLLRARARLRRVALAEVPTRPGDRLLEAPVFILSSVRSGSTLFRTMLTTHPQLHAPHELHLTSVTARLESRHAQAAMAALGLDEEQLQFLLWDRLLHRELVQHGKQILVEKTPSDALMWRKILRCWPDARFIFLLRHPGSVARSWQRGGRMRRPLEQLTVQLRQYMEAVEEARIGHGGLTVRYEDLTADPARELGRTCEFLGVAYEPAMLDYRTAVKHDFRPGLGDWSRQIRSGKIQPAAPPPPPEAVPDALLPIAEQWGYLDGSG